MGGNLAGTLWNTMSSGSSRLIVNRHVHMSAVFLSSEAARVTEAQEATRSQKGTTSLLPHLGSALEKPATIRELLPTYLAYAEYEWRLAPKTLHGYSEAIRRVLKVVGDITPQELDANAVLALKADLARRGVGPHWTRNILNGLRSFLRFCILVVGLDVLDPKAITLPRIPRRDVVFLSPDEVETFVRAIPVFKDNRQFDLRWLCCRSLVEVLVGTGMRISEALALERACASPSAGPTASSPAPAPTG